MENKNKFYTAKYGLIFKNLFCIKPYDNLKDLIYEKFNQKPMLRNVPVNMSVINNKVLPVLLDTKYKLDFIHSIMLQLIYYHSGKDLKIVIFTNKSNEYRWSYCRYLPHCWNSKFNKRFFAI